jgi:hypothetical protein
MPLAFRQLLQVRSAECGVQCSRLKFFGSAEALPSRKLPFHHSPIAIRHSLPFFPTCRFADLTIYRKLGSAGTSPSRLIPSCVPLSEKLDGD